eukprot:g34036.t1
MRIHSLENVDKALQFLKEQRVHLENVGSHDIVDGNHRLTLGLIWTIILRFQVTAAGKVIGLDGQSLTKDQPGVSQLIQVIKINTEDNRETRSAKDALLLWCQMKTAGSASAVTALPVPAQATEFLLFTSTFTGQ